MKDNYDISALVKKKKKNSRPKGNSFENKIAKIFNKKFGLEEFSRTPGSGAYATTHNLPEHLKIYGDLITPQNFKYCIECKKGYNKESLYSLYNNSSVFWTFMDKCQKDANKAKRLAMVVFKQDYKPTLAMIPSSVKVDQSLSYIEIKGCTEYTQDKTYRLYLFDELLDDETFSWFE
jgi:hypothetical protein